MKRDIYQEITNRIVHEMEKGRLPWERPWSKDDCAPVGTFGVPMNAATGRAYRGINICMLWAAAATMGSDDLRFMTFKQAKAAGGNVIKGSKGFKIFFFKKLEIERENDKGDTIKAQIPMLREFTVFHISQIDGLTKAKQPQEIDLDAMPEDINELAEAVDCELIISGDQAFYSPAYDRVNMPPIDSFKEQNGFRSVFYHELTHWTGHHTRMSREFGARGTDKYAREELVAELGAAFICAEFGIDYTTNHAAYLQSWIKALKNDKRMIFQAASAAQKAVDWLRAAAIADDLQAAA